MGTKQSLGQAVIAGTAWCLLAVSCFHAKQPLLAPGGRRQAREHCEASPAREQAAGHQISLGASGFSLSLLL